MEGFCMATMNPSKMHGRLLALLLAVCIILPVGAVSAAADDETDATSASASSEHTYDTGGDDYVISLYSDATDVEYCSYVTEHYKLLSDYDSSNDSTGAMAASYIDYDSYGLSADDAIVLTADTAVDADGNAQPLVTGTVSDGYAAYKNPQIYSNEDIGELIWTFQVKKAGLYHILVDYLPDETDTADVQRSVLIDGVSPFSESDTVPFMRKWEEIGAVKKDSNGDQLKPKMRQVYTWDSEYVSDVDGMYSDGLAYYLTPGQHTLTVGYVNCACYFGNITILPGQNLPSYEEYNAENLAAGIQPVDTSADTRVEAEDAAYRSSQILRRAANSDPATTPYTIGHVVLNTIGGYDWRTGNQSVTYKISVPTDGLYALNLRIFQNHGEGLSVHRQITIDGVVPFREVSAYAFEYGTKWQNVTVSDAEGTPYQFYLTAGEHEIAFTVKMGQATEVIKELYSINDDVTSLIRSITAITGSDPDLNYDYQLEKRYPQLLETMQDLEDRYRAQIVYLQSYCQKTPTLANSLNTAADQLAYLIKHPNKIPAKLDEMQDTQSSVSQWYYDIQDQPMQMDYLQMIAPDETVQMKKSNIFQKIAGTAVNFWNSFYKDYDSIQYAAEDDSIEVHSTINVWVARSKEMAEVIQEMGTEDFTQETGIGVSVNIMPTGSVGAVGSISPLMLAVISGTVPDIALGTDSQTPVELAIRDAAYDLTNFDDYDEFAESFLPGALEPLLYQDGCYAIPETMDFRIMFYRTDILSSLNVDIPQTWYDLYNRVLPVLNQNGMDFFMTSDYATYLYQLGGSYYNEDKTKTALDSDVAYQAFVQWTNNYNVYDMPETADIYNHFRIGDIPLVVGSYSDYIKLLYAAPEIYGKWDIAPIPGTYDDSGKLNRSAGGVVTCLMMFSDTVNKEDGWEFIKWWMSEDVQYNYSANIEGVMGLTARWNTANTDAFLRMNWNTNHKKVFRIVFNNFVNMPNTLGGYYTGRNVSNAWTRTVTNDVNTRASWEQAVEDIENEMERKQIEYGLIEEES